MAGVPHTCASGSGLWTTNASEFDWLLGMNLTVLFEIRAEKNNVIEQCQHDRQHDRVF